MPGRKASETARREQILSAAFTVAARHRLDGLTVRSVAAQAGLSPGLVFFHFRNKDTLLLELLDWLLETTLDATVTPEIAAFRNPRDRLLALLGTEISNLPAERARVELFFDYWLRGTRHPQMRERIRLALARYHGVFRGVAADLLAAAPPERSGLSADRVATLVVSFIQGCAMQAVIDEDFDVAGTLRGTAALVGGLPAAAPYPSAASG